MVKMCQNIVMMQLIKEALILLYEKEDFHFYT